MSTIQVRGINLDKVARAIAGHLIALDEKPQARHVMLRHLRRFVLNKQVGLEPSLYFHMWLFPFNRQGMLRDLFHAEFGAGYEPLWISAFKTYPLSFAFSTEVTNPNYRLRGVLDLTDAVRAAANGLFTLRIPTRPIVDSNWPFAPYRHGVILTSDNGSVTTTPYRNEKNSRS